MLYRCRTMLTRDVGPLNAFGGLRPNFELTLTFIQSSDNEISMAGKWNTLDNKYLKGKRKHLSTEFLSKCVFVILSNKTVAFYRMASSLKPVFFRRWLTLTWRFRVCCRITSEVEKCLKLKSRGVTRGFCILCNISTPRRLFCNNHENKYFISILHRQQNSSIEERSRSILYKNCSEQKSM